MNTKKQKLIAGLILLLILAAFSTTYAHIQEKKATPLQATAFHLNTVITLTIYDSQDKQALNDAMGLCAHYEKIFSQTLKESELYKLNHRLLPQNADGSYTVSVELADLIAKGLTYAKLSDGAFDITIGPVSSLWDFTSNEKKVPSQEEIQAALPYVGYQKMKLSQTNVFLSEGMTLDLGAVAKGYIADRIKDYLQKQGIRSATINLGGNVLCIGHKPDGTPFQIGIQKPFAKRNETAVVVDITDQSVVSSGIYERYFEKDGNFYHHILNPHTGFPYESDLTAVSIICDTSADGDALSTTCFVLGAEKGLALLNSLPNTKGCFFFENGELITSEDWPKQ